VFKQNTSRNLTFTSFILKDIVIITCTSFIPKYLLTVIYDDDDDDDDDIIQSPPPVYEIETT
jgi:hypothetical protein